MGQKVLFIGAHPDDIELGCGAAMYHHYLNKDEIGTVVLTRGEKGGNPEKRINEQSKAFSILAPGSKSYVCEFPDTKLFQYKNEIIDKLREIALYDKPDIVYVHHGYDFHQDHVTAYECTLSVFNYHMVHKLICYETPSTMSCFAPNFYCLCSMDHFKLKIKALKCHESQKGKLYFSEEIIRGTAKMRAVQGRYYDGMAEAFELIRYTKLLSPKNKN